MKRLQQAKDLVKGMNPQEREQLRQFLAVNRAIGPAVDHITEARRDDYAAIALDCICQVMADRGLDFAKPGSLERTEAFRSFKRKIAEDGIGEWSRKVTKKNKVKMRAFVHLCASLLCDDLITMREVVNSRTMMLHVHRIPAVVNANFPNYAQTGMLHWIIRQQGE